MNFGLHWLPLSAGGHSLALNGRVFEAAGARHERRARCDLCHSALNMSVPEARFVIDQAPARDSNGAERRSATKVRLEAAGRDVDVAQRVLGLASRVPTAVQGTGKLLDDGDRRRR